jgi:hypothetical protein
MINLLARLVRNVIAYNPDLMLYLFSSKRASEESMEIS